MLLLEKTPWAKHKSKDFASVLISGAKSGHAAVVKMMFHRGVNIESRNAHDQTALSCAAGADHLHVVEMLLDWSADIETKDEEGYTPLMHAITEALNPSSAHSVVVARLLQRRANVKTKNEAGQTAISLALKPSVTTPLWGGLELLLEHDAILNTTHDENVEILMEAARMGQIGVLRFFLEKQNFSVESKGEGTEGVTYRSPKPLHYAACYGRDATVEYLLGRNANIEAKNGDGNASLTYAATRRKISVIRILLKNDAEIDPRNIRAETPLLMAIRTSPSSYDTGHEAQLVDIVETLIAHGADTEVKDEDGMTPLLWAVNKSQALVVRSLLEHNVRTDCKDRNGRTALELAEYLGEKKVVALLLRLDHQSSSVLDWTRTPLSEAAEKGHESVVKQYLNEGHDIEAKDGVFAQTALVWAAENGHERVVQLLLEHGAQIESSNKYRQTALMLGVRNNHCRVVELLLKWNADVESKDIASRTPFMMINERKSEAVRHMMKNSARFRNNFSNNKT